MGEGDVEGGTGCWSEAVSGGAEPVVSARLLRMVSDQLRAPPFQAPQSTGHSALVLMCPHPATPAGSVVAPALGPLSGGCPDGQDSQGAERRSFASPSSQGGFWAAVLRCLIHTTSPFTLAATVQP